MGLIQCSEECKFQKEGYCCLEKCSKVNSTDKNCPYFSNILSDNADSFIETSNADKL